MEISNFTLAHLVAELKQYAEGAFLNSFQPVREGFFKIKLHSKEHGTIDLIAAPNALYKTNYKIPAAEKQSGFAAFVKKQLYNKRVVSIEQHGSDRIIEMHFSDNSIVFELFAKGNIILKGKDEKIISCYTNEEWRDRKTRRGEQYKYPASKPAVSSLTAKDFGKIMKESPQDCVRAIVSALNVAPLAAEEACARAQVEKTRKAISLSERETTGVFSELKKIYSPLLEKARPIVIETQKEPQLLPFQFETTRSEKAKEFSSLSEALDESISHALLAAEEKKLSAETAQKKARLQYSLAEQLKARGRLEKDAEESKKKAELVYLHYSEIKELVSAVCIALEKKIDKKEIMYKIKSLGEKGNQPAKLLIDFDPKTKKLVLDLPDK